MIIGLGVAEAARAQAGDRWTRGAIEFVELLRSEQFDSAASRVSASIPAGALSPERLGQIWAQLTTTSGALTALEPETVIEQNGQHVVDLAARFERQPLKIRVVLDDALDLTGLWFLPPSPPPYDPPAWVDTTAFREIDVSVGEAPWILPGTLAVPVGGGPYPAVVLVHGSGPHDRDETIGPNRPFRDLAWALASRGIAVLRYEKRTKAYAGHIDTADFTVDQEVVEDALAAIATLRQQEGIEPGRIFVAGHSLGAMMAPAIARRDGQLAGVILLAAPARPLHEVLRDQLEYIASLPTTDETSRASIRETLDTIARLERHSLPDTTNVMGAPAAYYYDLSERDPVADAGTLGIPILILHGGRDYQVTGRDLALWRERLTGDGVTIREFPDLNHLFIEGQGRATPTEYFALAGHVAQPVIDAIVHWIRETG